MTRTNGGSGFPSPISERKNERLTAKFLAEHVRSRIEFERRWYDAVADRLTKWFGTMTFLALNIAAFAAWILWNSGQGAIDPFPFNLLTMAVSLEAIALSIVVLISQNRQGRIADIRQQIDFEINVRAEDEIRKMVMMLEKTSEHLGIKPLTDSELKRITRKTDIEEIKEAVQELEDVGR